MTQIVITLLSVRHLSRDSTCGAFSWSFFLFMSKLLIFSVIASGWWAQFKRFYSQQDYKQIHVSLLLLLVMTHFSHWDFSWFMMCARDPKSPCSNGSSVVLMSLTHKSVFPQRFAVHLIHTICFLLLWFSFWTLNYVSIPPIYSCHNVLIIEDLFALVFNGVNTLPW